MPILDGIATLSAADGSTLTTAFAGGQDAPVGGVATYSHDHRVIAGTGRFADADGQFTVTGTIDFGTFTVDGTVNGWLSY